MDLSYAARETAEALSEGLNCVAALRLRPRIDDAAATRRVLERMGAAVDVVLAKNAHVDHAPAPAVRAALAALVAALDSGADDARVASLCTRVLAAFGLDPR